MTSKIRALGFSLAFFLVTSTAYALPVYVQSMAKVTTGGAITNGIEQAQNTGQLQTPAAVAGPFDISSEGVTYDFDAKAGFVTEVGHIHGHVETTALSTAGVIGGATAEGFGQWNDNITIVSDTLAQGTPVTFLATITLERAISGSVGVPAQASAAAILVGPFGLALVDVLNAPNDTESVSVLVNTTVGSVLSASSTLSLQAFAVSTSPSFFLTASVFADNSAHFFFESQTLGASYITESGARFDAAPPAAVPEPSTLLLGGIGMMLVRLRRRQS